MNLYTLNREYIDIITEVEELEGELTPELEERLAGNADGFDSMMENLSKAVINLRSDAEAIKCEKMRLAKLQAAKERSVESIRRVMLNAMRLRQTDRTRAGQFSISTRRTKAVEVDDGAVIPDEYCRVVKTADKTALKDAIEGGAEIEGVRIVENESIQIK